MKEKQARRGKILRINRGGVRQQNVKNLAAGATAGPLAHCGFSTPPAIHCLIAFYDVWLSSLMAPASHGVTHSGIYGTISMHMAWVM